MDIETQDNQIVSIKKDVDFLKMNIGVIWCALVLFIFIIASLITAMLSYSLEKANNGY